MLQDNKTSTDNLSTALQSSISHMSRVVAEISCNCARMRPEDSNATRILRSVDQISKTFDIIMRAFNHLCRNILGRQTKGRIIHLLVKFFENILDQLHKVCAYEAQHETNGSRNVDHENAQTIQATREKFHISRKFLSKLIAHILTSMDIQKGVVGHAEIVEGCMWALLTRLGDLISQEVFGEGVKRLDTPGRISPTKGPQPRTLRDDIANRSEGHQLVSILRQALNSRTGTVAEVLSGTAPRPAHPDSRAHLDRRTSDLSNVMKKFQATLCKGIFGEHNEDFLDVLRRSNSPDELLNSPDRLPDKEVPENEDIGFVERAYFTVGWDILKN